MHWFNRFLRHAACALLIALMAPAAHAAFIIVNTLDDELNNDGDCSLREAVQAANTNVAVDACTAGHNTGGGLDVILFAANLQGGEIPVSQIMVVTQALTIIGTNQHLRLTTAYRIFEVNMTNPAHGFALQNLTLSGGWTQLSELQVAGTAVQLKRAGPVTFSNVTFRNNSQSAVAHLGGALGFGSVASVTVELSRFEDNETQAASRPDYGGWGGAAMWLRGVPEVTIRYTTFRNNHHRQYGFGAALRLEDFDQARISDSVFVNNTALLQGGGALHVRGTIESVGALSVHRTTFSGNRGGSSGGDIVVDFPVRAHIVNSTFHDTKGAVQALNYGEAIINTSTFIGNDSHLGFLNGSPQGVVSLDRSVLFGSPFNPLCTASEGGTVFSGGNNRFQQGDTSCNLAPSDQGIDDPRLMPLGDYGGPVPVMLPRIDSPLIDAAGATCGTDVAIDARGLPRPVSGTGSGTPLCDIGAVEFNPDHDLILIDDIFADGFE